MLTVIGIGVLLHVFNVPWYFKIVWAFILFVSGMRFFLAGPALLPEGLAVLLLYNPRIWNIIFPLIMPTNGIIHLGIGVLIGGYIVWTTGDWNFASWFIVYGVAQLIGRMINVAVMADADVTFFDY